MMYSKGDFSMAAAFSVTQKLARMCVKITAPVIAGVDEAQMVHGP